jgi:hypothetical protein
MTSLAVTRELPFEFVASCSRAGGATEIALKGNLLRRVRELLVAQPDRVPSSSRGSLITTLVTQQESLDPLPHLMQIVGSSMSSADQIAHRLVPFVRNPDRRELVCAQ